VLNAQGEYAKLIDLLPHIVATPLDVTPAVRPAMKPGCSYFTARMPEGFRAFEAVVLLDELSEEELKTVQIRRGKHGYELVSDELCTSPVDTLVFICNSNGLVTWYPGRLTCPLPPKIGQATVKLLP
jgi:hypothetical protein